MVRNALAPGRLFCAVVLAYVCLIHTPVCAQSYPHHRDVWAYYPLTSAWEQLSTNWPLGVPESDLPGFRRNHAAAYDPFHDRMIVISGHGKFNVQYHDIWSFSLASRTWSRIALADGSTSMPYMIAREALLDESNRRLILAASGDAVYTLDLDSDLLTTAPASQWPFPARPWAVYAFDESRQQLLAYGGADNDNASSITQIYDDLWVYDFQSTATDTRWRQLSTSGDMPGSRWLTRAVIDASRDRLIMFGGNMYPNFYGGEYTDETYELDLATRTWTSVPALTPPSRRGQIGAAWDSNRGRELIFGGLFRKATVAMISFGELWEYNPAAPAWTQLPTRPGFSSPSYRRYCSMVYAPQHDCVLVFGGEGIYPSYPRSRAAIKIPRNGQHIAGNRTTVMAELTTGLPELTRDIRFQYRQPSITGTWTDIPAADPAQHPNPDPTSPYFIHWDIDALPEGPLDIHAITTDTMGYADAVPEEITVIVKHTGPDVRGVLSSVPDSDVSVRHTAIPAATTDSGSASCQSNANLLVRIPEYSLDITTELQVNVVPLSQVGPLSASPASIGFFLDVISTSGQTMLTGGGRASLSAAYPDADNDGIVDGTSVPESQLRVCRITPTGDVEPLADSTVDTVTQTVRATTDQLGRYAVLGNISAGVDSWELY